MSALAHLVAGVAVGLTHRELIVLVLFVEAEGKAEHVSVVVGGRSTIVIKLIKKEKDVLLRKSALFYRKVGEIKKEKM